MGLRNGHNPGIGLEFDQFVRRHARPVLAYCLRRSSHADAHEAAAEVFSIAWRRFEAVPDGEAALYWLFGVARRVLSNQRRASARRQGLAQRVGSGVTPAMPSAETVVVRSARDEEVISALRTLDERDQEVLVLVVWDEMPRPKISELLGVTQEAVHKRYQRALRRLERALNATDRRTSTPSTEERGSAR